MKKSAGHAGIDVPGVCSGSGAVKIRWLLTAGFEMTAAGTRLLVDPYLSRTGTAQPRLSLCPEDFTDARWVFVSHGHFDHAYDVPAIVRASGAKVAASHSVCASLARKGVPRGRLHPLAAGEILRGEGFAVKAIRSRHVRFDLRLMGRTLGRLVTSRETARVLARLRWPPGEVLGWLFDFAGFTVAHFGSPAYFEEEIRGLKPDLLLLPVQGHTRIHRMAAEMASLAAPKAVFPMHWDDFCPPFSQMVPLEPLLREMAKAAPGVEVCGAAASGSS